MWTYVAPSADGEPGTLERVTMRDRRTLAFPAPLTFAADPAGLRITIDGRETLLPSQIMLAKEPNR